MLRAQRHRVTCLGQPAPGRAGGAQSRFTRRGRVPPGEALCCPSKDSFQVCAGTEGHRGRGAKNGGGQGAEEGGGRGAEGRRGRGAERGGQRGEGRWHRGPWLLSARYKKGPLVIVSTPARGLLLPHFTGGKAEPQEGREACPRPIMKSFTLSKPEVHSWDSLSGSPSSIPFQYGLQNAQGLGGHRREVGGHAPRPTGNQRCVTSRSVSIWSVSWAQYCRGGQVRACVSPALSQRRRPGWRAGVGNGAKILSRGGTRRRAGGGDLPPVGALPLPRHSGDTASCRVASWELTAAGHAHIRSV